MQIVVANSKGGSGKSTLVMALADILSNAQVVDLDNQGTITSSSHVTGRHMPIQPEEATGRYILYDTPPYHGEEIRGLFRSADLILIPMKVGYPDLLATKTIIEDLKDLGLLEKGILVLNEVKKPYTNAYKKIKRLIEKHYQDVRKAQTELSYLTGFHLVLGEPIKGKAREEMMRLAQELELTTQG